MPLKLLKYTTRQSTRHIQQHYLQKTNQTYKLKARRARARWWKPSQHIAFAKQGPSSQRLEAFEFSATPFSCTPDPTFLKCKPQPPSQKAVYTCDFLTPRSASQSGYPRDYLEPQQARSKDLAAFITVTRFARDAAPSLSGRVPPQPSAGIDEPPHFGVFISLACPPKTLSPHDR